MKTVRKSADRGYAKHDWLESQHTFSFASYQDPKHMGFRALRVINEDWIAPGKGFAPHPHSDMEILTYVISGALEHKDSLGNGSVIRPGDVQRMSAGTGVVHSEYNASTDEPVHLLQIWIHPEKRGLAPSYEQRSFDISNASDELILLASQDGKGDSVRLHQDVNLFGGKLSAGQRTSFGLEANRGMWLQLIQGTLLVGDFELASGDAIQIEEDDKISLIAKDDSEFLIFDLV